MRSRMMLLAIATLSLSGCAKKYCWECTTVEAGGGTGTSYATYCDYTEEDIQNKIGTTTAVDSTGPKPIQIIYTTTCQKID